MPGCPGAKWTNRRGKRGDGEEEREDGGDGSQDPCEGSTCGLLFGGILLQYAVVQFKRIGQDCVNIQFIGCF